MKFSRPAIFRASALTAAAALLAAACGATTDDAATPPAVEASPGALVDSRGDAIPAAPEGVPDGDLAPELEAAVDQLWAGLSARTTDLGEPLDVIGASRDVRVAWLLSDMLRFFQSGSVHTDTVRAFEQLTGQPLLTRNASAWGASTDRLIAWDLPAPPGYRERKGELFTTLEPGWQPFFDDADATIDWRHLSWGGVRIDDRPIEEVAFPCPDGCIPALNFPALVPAAEGDWYPDDRVVFGVVIGDEAVAFPKNIMEVHEMVNMTIGGRRIGMPYCTLCGSAQVYFTDTPASGFDDYELRTSGLLSRSNKVMFDLHTRSVFDTFTGEAVSGPLREAGVVLEQATVVTSTWEDWKASHPDTTIVAEDGGIGRSYPLDPLRGRDDDGPIFPIGDVDPRLDVQTNVVGAIGADGEPVAFPVDAAREVLEAGGSVELAGISLAIDGSGLTAMADGEPVPVHQSFWFAWSQFYGETLLWMP